ncbi:MAG: DUF1850 domain-containing protein [Rhodoferax sp.]|nr:DUF1850 domain-containing protein [Rhodoferax sp.]MCB2027843.1 DUF1850 domain-containing protein [Rhodoferax sp.]MCP5261139.1 DUF1850 domain-containing protein [Rhodoferax sp.]
MMLRQRAAMMAAALLLPLAVPAAVGCELVLSEHRSGRPLARLALDPHRPAARIAFTHSVLGTPVVDHYEWRPHAGQWRAHMVQEHFEGDGYGLPNAAGPGETMVRDGDGWRLYLDRVVHPLVVLPLPAQSMRVSVGEQPALLLGSLSQRSIEFRARDCPTP